VNSFFKDIWGIDIHDQYGQTEGGMMVINSPHPLLKTDFEPGTIGTSMPGFSIGMIDQQQLSLTEGELCININNSPLYWFTKYWKNPIKSKERLYETTFGNVALTGDRVKFQNGKYHFLGRVDDIILSAGYRIGPTEVEDAIIKHNAVTDCAVIGVPDAERGQIIKAFVVLKSGVPKTEELKEEIKEFVKTNLSKHQYPRIVELVDSLPKTDSLKTQRYKLR